jgi:hypothetical protein
MTQKNSWLRLKHKNYDSQKENNANKFILSNRTADFELQVVKIELVRKIDVKSTFYMVEQGFYLRSAYNLM